MTDRHCSFFLPALLLALVLAMTFPVTAQGADRKGYTTINTTRFILMMQHKDFYLLDVHTPYQGEIPETDEWLPYDRIATHRGLLPKDKNARIVVYCMGSAMGASAARTLVNMGYTHVIQYEDGMFGWQEQGGRLVYKKR